MSEDNPSLDRKQEILSSAKSLFAQKGYAATSIKDITSEAGVNVGLVSYYFGGKEGLYRACLEDFANEQMKFWESNVFKMTSKEDFRFRIRVLLEQMLYQEVQNPEAGRLIRRDVESEDPIVVEAFKKTVLVLYESFIDFIKTAQNKKYIRSDLAPNLIASLFMGGIQHMIRSDRLMKKLYGKSIENEKYRNQVIETALELFLKGVQL